MTRIPALSKTGRVFACEQNSLVTPPFPVVLPDGGVVDLCSVQVSRDCREAFSIQAIIGWSATFTPLVPPTGEIAAAAGSAQITFELLKNGSPIFRVTETNEQPVFEAGVVPSSQEAVTGFVTTKLLHVDLPSLLDSKNAFTIFSLRAINIILTPPASQLTFNPVATVTAQAGAVTLTLEEACLRR